MAISRFSSSRVTQGLPKYQSAWDTDNVQQGALVPIQQIVATTNTADLTFNNVPQIYQDLMIVFNGRTTGAQTVSNLFITGYYVGMPTSPQSSTHLQGTGVNPVTSYRYSNQDGAYAGIIPGANGTAGYFGSCVGYFFNYANTTANKTFIYHSGSDMNGSGNINLGVNLTRGTAPITQVNVSTFNGSVFFALGTTATLYGIKAGV
jgi:hypothetical protein